MRPRSGFGQRCPTQAWVWVWRLGWTIWINPLGLTESWCMCQSMGRCAFCSCSSWGVLGLFLFLFFINNACWPLFSSVVWKVLNVAKFKELGKGVVGVRQRHKMPFFSPVLLALWPAGLWPSLVRLSPTCPAVSTDPSAVSTDLSAVRTARAGRVTHRGSRPNTAPEPFNPRRQLCPSSGDTGTLVQQNRPPKYLRGCAVGFFLLNSKGVALLSFSEGRVGGHCINTVSTARFFPCALEERSCNITYRFSYTLLLTFSYFYV